MCKAQVSVSTSGGEATGVAGSVSYSVGQVTYMTNIDSDGSVAEGVQQPFEISIITGVEQKYIELTISAYPNPVKDQLILKINNDSWITQKLMLVVYDVNGMVIKQSTIDEKESIINMIQFKPGIYFLMVIQNEKETKVFKVVKK